MGVFFPTQHNQQVADHIGLPLLIELNDVLRFQLRQGHFHHTNRAIDDLPACSHNGLGLLPLEHGAGNFLGVRQVADSGFDHLYAGLLQAILYFPTQRRVRRVTSSQRADTFMGTDLSYEDLEEQDLLKILGPGLVLTGAGVSMPGALELAQNVFNLPVRTGEPGVGMSGLADAVRRPKFATSEVGVGLGMTFTSWSAGK